MKCVIFCCERNRLFFVLAARLTRTHATHTQRQGCFFFEHTASGLVGQLRSPLPSSPPTQEKGGKTQETPLPGCPPPQPPLPSASPTPQSFVASSLQVPGARPSPSPPAILTVSSRLTLHSRSSSSPLSAAGCCFCLRDTGGRSGRRLPGAPPHWGSLFPPAPARAALDPSRWTRRRMGAPRCAPTLRSSGRGRGRPFRHRSTWASVFFPFGRNSSNFVSV